jgi:hypothetical protein
LLFLQSHFLEYEPARAELACAKAIVLRCRLLVHVGAQAQGDGNDLTRKVMV